MNVMLNSIDKVQDFVNTVSHVEDNIDLTLGRHMVDAKSILGILSLDLSKPLKVEFNGSDHQEKIKSLLQMFEA